MGFFTSVLKLVESLCAPIEHIVGPSKKTRYDDRHSQHERREKTGARD